MFESDPEVKAASAWVRKVLIIAMLALIILHFLVGCASNPYQTTHSTPYIQFSHEGKKEIPRSPRALYFDNHRRAIDNSIPLGICVA